MKHDSDDVLKRINGNGKKLVFLFCDNSYLSVLVYLSMLRGGYAVFLGNGKMDTYLKTKLLKVYKPDLIWSSEYIERIEGYEEFAASAEVTFLKQSQPDSTPIHPDLGLLLSTSGTTGSPKLVRLSYKNIQANAESIVKYLEIATMKRQLQRFLALFIRAFLLHSHLQAARHWYVQTILSLQNHFGRHLRNKPAPRLRACHLLIRCWNGSGLSE